MKRINRQSGFSLIELMVAMLIGIFILGGVTKVFMDSRGSDQMRDGMSSLSNNARIAMSILSSDIARAGYHDAPNMNVETFKDSVDNDATGSDQIVVSYESDKDCLGNSTPASLAKNKYFLRLADGTTNPSGEHPSSADAPANVWQLMCEGNGNPGYPQPIVEGIESLQFLYGVDDDQDGVANHYDTAKTVDAHTNTSNMPWNNVVSVRIGLLAYSGDNVLRGQDEDTHNYQVLDVTVNPASGDRRARQILVKTVPVRNIIYENLYGG